MEPITEPPTDRTTPWRDTGGRQSSRTAGSLGVAGEEPASGLARGRTHATRVKRRLHTHRTRAKGPKFNKPTRRPPRQPAPSPPSSRSSSWPIRRSPGSLEQIPARTGDVPHPEQDQTASTGECPDHAANRTFSLGERISHGQRPRRRAPGRYYQCTGGPAEPSNFAEGPLRATSSTRVVSTYS